MATGRFRPAGVKPATSPLALVERALGLAGSGATLLSQIGPINQALPKP